METSENPRSKLALDLAMITSLLAMALHYYLTAQHYDLKLGLATGQSLCNLNQAFNCDAVNISAYSSILGIPLSLFGLITNALLLLVLVVARFEWTEQPGRIQRLSFWGALLIAFASIVMGAISLFALSTYCLFCIGAYICSFIVLGCTWWYNRGTIASNTLADLRSLIGSAKWVLVLVIITPLMAFVMDKGFMDMRNGRDMDARVRASIFEWQASPVYRFDLSTGLAKGASADRAQATIVEFADFRCPHCRTAAIALDAFIQGRNDVRLIFKHFPLDGTCNPVLERGDGISCRLALAAHCAEEIGKKGWGFARRIFARQPDFRSLSQTNSILRDFARAEGLDFSALESCMSSEAAALAIAAQAREGETAQISGTPAIFINGKQVRGGHIIPVLDAITREAVKSQNSM